MISRINSGSRNEDTSAGLAAISDQANLDADKITDSIRALTRSEEDAASKETSLIRGHGEESDLYDTMTVRTPEDLRASFTQNQAVVFGDSMVEGINDGGYLNSDSLVFKRGISTGMLDTYIDQVVSLKPKILFIQLGLNDLDDETRTAEDFKSLYIQDVEKLQAALPDCRIYLNNINRVLESAYTEHPGFARYKEFNQAVIETASTCGCAFIDNSSLIGSHDEIFDTDGSHPIQKYYLAWLSHMAYEADI